jgi:hypothetical protein
MRRPQLVLFVSALMLPALVQVACDLGVVGTGPTDGTNTPDSAVEPVDAQSSKDAGADSEPVRQPLQPHPLAADAGPTSQVCNDALDEKYAKHAVEYNGRCYWITNELSAYPEMPQASDDNPCRRGVIASGLSFEPAGPPPNAAPGAGAKAIALDYEIACRSVYCWIGASTFCAISQIDDGQRCTLTNVGFHNTAKLKSPQSDLKRTLCVYPPP